MGVDILIKTVLTYFIVLIIMKIMGKREIGQLSLFDFVILLLIADVIVMGINDSLIPFYYYFLAVVILTIIQKILSFILLKFPKLRNFFDGKESLIIIEGKVNLKEMKRINYNFNDLIVQMRLKNVRSLSEVRFLFLEPNGEVSIFKYDDFTQRVSSTTKDKKGSSSIVENSKCKNIFPLPLIVSGVICYENLNILKIKEEWIMEKIKAKGYKRVEEIYYANYENDDIFILEIYEF